jgi:hypothetical protein
MLGLGLGGHHEIETPRQPPEQVAGAADRCGELTVLDRDAGAPGCGLEAGDRGIRRRIARGPLHVDDVGRDAAHDARRHHRLVAERDAAQMRAECFGDRDGVIGSHVMRLAETEIDDEILDHPPCSPLARRAAHRPDAIMLGRRGCVPR